MYCRPKLLSITIFLWVSPSQFSKIWSLSVANSQILELGKSHSGFSCTTFSTAQTCNFPGLPQYIAAMGKRKASRSSGPSGPKSLDPADARLAIRTHEDIADDQEQYFMDQDKIMLEDEPQSKRARTDDRIDEFLEASDDEVFRDNDTDSDDEYAELQKAAKAQSKKKKKKGVDDDDEDEEQAGEEEGDEGYWGDSRKEYYNADQIETEADALEEEAEAKRLQKKKLADMDEADFIFDEDEWTAPTDEVQEGAEVVTEELQDIEVTDDMDADERNRLLRARYPEFVPLVEEFETLQSQLVQLRKEAEGKPAKSLEVVRHWMLGCYVAALASYFAVLTSPSQESNKPTVPLSPVELRDHEVMETLVSCRDAWQLVKDLKSTKSAAEEMEVDLADENSSLIEEAIPVKKLKKKVEVNGDSKKKKKAEKERLAKARAVEDSLADLEDLVTRPKKTKKVKAATRIQSDNNSDFGEEETLDARTAADKAAKKKSLRFYTSQIVQKASKRADAGRDAGGDLDIPYRERLRDRAARLNAEAENRGKKSSKLGTALGDDDASSGDEAVAKQVRGEEDEYYDMVAHRTKAKKDDKTARKEALAAAKITDRVVEVSTIGEDGKRKINYQIEKNKGLAPKRKKDVRNPRVKKRKKYEEKQKKLKSMKAVYQGGEGKGGYQGETTGIKTGLIKSVKL